MENNVFKIKYDLKKIIPDELDSNLNRTQHRYIITGGPGAGKTSIINYLAKQGYMTMPEAATEIIEYDIKQGIEKPWRFNNYHSRVAHLNKQRQTQALKSEAPVIFFDRGHLDGITYILLQKRELCQDVIDFVKSSMGFFDATIFFIESLGFCQQGFARNETLEEALEKSYHLEHNYLKLGYTIIKIPIGSVEERAEKIINFTERDYLI